MLTINSENAKQIRTPFEVYTSFSYRETDNDLTFTLSGDIEAVDSNYNEMLDNPDVSMRILTDLSNGGFITNGDAEWSSTAAGSVDTGKIGLRSKLGGIITVSVAGSKVINSLTVAVTGGSGTVVYGGTSYPTRRIVVVPVNSKTATLTITADSGTRLDVASITAGISLDFDNSNIISCTLALRSNLDITDANWQVSDIEIQAYYPDDISEAISNVGDDVPITYYAGYDGDYSEMRTFYLSEKATLEENVLTLKGEDISSKLEDQTFYSEITYWNNKYNKANTYIKLKSILASALGTNFPITAEANPPAYGSRLEPRFLVWKEQTAKDVIQGIMNIFHTGDFYPVFIDAGIPTLRWSKPESKWDIYEEDCSSVSRGVDRNINVLVSDDDYGMQTTVSVANKSAIQSDTVEKGKTYDTNFDSYVRGVTVSNANVIKASASGVTYKAKKSGTSTIKGQVATIKNATDKLTSDRAGISSTISPFVYGELFDTDGTTLLFPNWANLFNRSNVTGSFTFKGDPRMQPRDVFTFHRLDGTEELCTIETITLAHEGGGTSAELTYRKGVV